MAQVVKSGYLKRYSKSLLDGGWQNVWVVLHKDSNLCVYKKQGDSSPKFHVFMKDVCKYFAYGQFTEGMKDRPSVPGGRVNCLLAVPDNPSHKAKIFWFLADDEAQLHAWMEAICSTLPQKKETASASSSSAPPIQPQHQHSVSSAPPPYSAGPPQPMPSAGPIGFDGMQGPPPGQYQQQPGYPQQYSPYPQQSGPYPQQPGPYPQQGGYPQQYPQPGAYHPPSPYPQHQGYPQQPGAYPQQYYPGNPQQQYSGYAPQPGYGPPPPGQYYGPPPQQVVYASSGHKKKNKNMANTAAALAGGALLGYGASRAFGGFGLGPRWGSWSSLSSFGSCGSFGSFGSFD